MNTITILAVWGGLVIFITAVSTVVVYQRYNNLRKALYAEIQKAEQDLQEDLLKFDKSELEQTQSGRDLLTLLENSRVSDKILLNQTKNAPILREDLLSDQASIILSGDVHTSLFAITCHISGVEHTRYFANQDQANTSYEITKKLLEDLDKLLSDETGNVTIESVRFELEKFAKLFQ